jgi:hypothetical protein
MAATGLQSKANRGAQVQAPQSKSQQAPGPGATQQPHSSREENKMKLTLANQAKLVAIPALTLAAGLSLAACGSAKAPAAAPTVTHTVTAPAAAPKPSATTAPTTPAPTTPAPAPVKTVYVQAPAAPAPAAPAAPAPTAQSNGLPAGAWFPAGYPNVACGPPTPGTNGLNTRYLQSGSGYTIDGDDPTLSPCNS